MRQFQQLTLLIALLLLGSGTLQAKIEAVAVSIEASGWMETTELKEGVVAYANRTYVYGSISPELEGLQITRYQGGTPPKIRAKATESGDMYIAVSNEDQSYNPTTNGWTLVSGLQFQYNDPNKTTFAVYKKTVNDGDESSINATGWQGVLILSSKTIDYTLITSFTAPPGVVIHNSKANTKKYIGSPSIVVLEDGTYLASHDYFGTRTESFVYKSTDKGKTWSQIANIMDLKWATIFRRANEVYLLGVRVDGTEYGNTVILKSEDGGVTWTNPTNSKNGLLLSGHYHCAPVPLIQHNGRLWRAMEDQGEPEGWGKFKAFMMSIDENADLLDASNWISSNKLTFNGGSNNYGSAWLEGNAVVAKDGSVKNILRVHYGGDDIAAIIDVSADGKTSTFDPENGFTYLPGALKKFTIRYDEVSEKYWTLSSYVLPQDRSGNLERVRNTIVLCSSTNLRDWEVVDILLHVDERYHHGFQYLDWLFEGNDIIVVSRTAWDDETGQADSQHNANYITFHRVENFRFDKKTANSGVSVKRWYNDAKSAIALTFDDGFKAHHEYAYPILKQYNIPGTFFVNSGNLVNKGDAQKERYGFWEDFKEMADDGHEIGSHSLTHPDLTTLTYDKILSELWEDKKNIESKIEQPCLTHAYPFCKHNDNVDIAANNLKFIAGRQCGEIANEASVDQWNWNSFDSNLLTWITPRSLDNEKKSATNLKTEIQSKVRQSRKFGVLCIHEVLPFDLLSTSNTYEIATTEWLAEICQYLDEKRTSKDIWPSTFSNIVRYAKERDNLLVDRIEYATDSIVYHLSTRLDPSIYNVPLTMEITVPTGWKEVSLLIMEDAEQISTTSYTDAPQKVKVNAIPDQQRIVLVNNTASSIEFETNNNQYTVYPNPVKDKLYIQNKDEGMDMQVHVYSLSGIKVLDSKISNNQVDVKSLASGPYIITINEGYTTRFIKE